MKRESLLNLKTSREVMTSMDLVRQKRPAPTMFQRMRRLIARGTKESIPHPNEAALAIELDKEKRRFHRRLETIERSAAKVLGFRRKLGATFEKHRRIMDMRTKLQRQYWQETSPLQLKRRSSPEEGIQEEPRPRLRVKRWRYGGKS